MVKENLSGAKIIEKLKEREKLAESIAKDYSLNSIMGNKTEQENNINATKLYMREAATWKQAIELIIYLMEN